MLPWYYCDNSFCDRPFFLLSQCLPSFSLPSWNDHLHLVFFLTALFACLSHGLPFEQLLLLTEPHSSTPGFASEVSLQKYLLLWIVYNIQHMLTMETKYTNILMTKNTNLETRKRNYKQVCALSYNLAVSGDTVGYWLEYFTGLINSPNSRVGCSPN